MVIIVAKVIGVVIIITIIVVIQHVALVPLQEAYLF